MASGRGGGGGSGGGGDDEDDEDYDDRMLKEMYQRHLAGLEEVTRTTCVTLLGDEVVRALRADEVSTCYVNEYVVESLQNALLLAAEEHVRILVKEVRSLRKALQETIDTRDALQGEITRVRGDEAMARREVETMAAQLLPNSQKLSTPMDLPELVSLLRTYLVQREAPRRNEMATSEFEQRVVGLEAENSRLSALLQSTTTEANTLRKVATQKWAEAEEAAVRRAIVAEAEVQRLRTHIASLEAHRGETWVEGNAHHQRAANLEKQLAEANQEIERMRSSGEELNRHVARVEWERNTGRASLRLCQKENERLTAEIEHYKHHTRQDPGGREEDERRQAAQVIAELTAEVEAESERCRVIETYLRLVVDILQTVHRNDLTAEGPSHERLLQAMDGLERTRLEMGTRVPASTLDLERMQTALEQASFQWTQQETNELLEGRDAEILALRGELDALRREARRAEARAESVEEENIELKDNLSRLQDEITLQQNSVRDAAARQVMEMQKELETLKSHLYHTQEENERTKRGEAVVRTQLEEAHKDLAEKAELADQAVSVLERVGKERRESVDLWRKELREKVAAVEDRRMKEEALAQKRIEEVEAAHAKAQQQVNEAQGRADQLEESLKNLQEKSHDKVAELTERLQSAVVSYEQESLKSKVGTSQMEQMQRSLKEAREMVKALNARVLEQDNCMEDLKALLEHERLEGQDRDRLLGKARGHLQCAKEALESCKTDLEITRQDVLGAEAQRRRVLQGVTVLVSQLEAAWKKHDVMEMEVERTRDLAEKCMAMETKLSTAEARLLELEGKNAGASFTSQQLDMKLKDVQKAFVDVSRRVSSEIDHQARIGELESELSASRENAYSIKDTLSVGSLEGPNSFLDSLLMEDDPPLDEEFTEDRASPLSPVEITLSEPTIHGSGYRSYLSLKIRAKVSSAQTQTGMRREESVVRRRERDFFWLHSALQFAHPTWKLSCLPATSPPGASVEELLTMFVTFMDRLAAKRQLMDDVHIRHFLTASYDVWVKHMRSASESSGLPSPSTPTSVRGSFLPGFQPSPPAPSM